VQTKLTIPDYLREDFAMYFENMSSLNDPENPDLLAVYLDNLFEQLKKLPLMFADMVDQLAMAITTKVRIDCKGLAALDLTTMPDWSAVKPFVGVHRDARACVTSIMGDAEQALNKAVLLIYYYQGYDATPLELESNDQDEDLAWGDYHSNNYDDNGFDENY
jgi:hypothetical protein